MSTAELIEAIRRLPPEELREVRHALAELDAAAMVRDQLVREGLATPSRGKLPPHTPLALHLDPPLSQTIIEERR
ncbi:MAG: hypothetical protein HYU66_24415 [Armatimonadetes bacterium]|nr:hypothetical protein [Armatimonadota bacterium]